LHVGYATGQHNGPKVSVELVATAVYVEFISPDSRPLTWMGAAVTKATDYSHLTIRAAANNRPYTKNPVPTSIHV